MLMNTFRPTLALALIFLIEGTSPEGNFASSETSRTSEASETFETPNPRIVDGEVVKKGDYPFLAVVRFTKGGRRIQCGGSIIAPTIILTAAHCVHKPKNDPVLDPKDVDSFEVVVGETSLIEAKIKPEHIYKVQKIVPHPCFNPDGIRGSDIAKVILKKPIPYGRLMGPVPLPRTNAEASGKGIVLGWGYTPKNPNTGSLDLLKAPLGVVNRSECKDIQGEGFPHKEFLICGGPKDMTCKGDSGGPFILKGALIGITSFSFNEGCGQGDKQGVMWNGVYTDVAKYTCWILRDEWHKSKTGGVDCSIWTLPCRPEASSGRRVIYSTTVSSAPLFISWLINQILIYTTFAMY